MNAHSQYRRVSRWMGWCVLISIATACTTSDQSPAPLVQEVTPFTRLYAEMEALGERDDLDAYDARENIRYALKNRSWQSVQTDEVSLSGIDEAARDEEKKYREAWRTKHIAYSWDNLDPDAQLEPKPAQLSLTWLEMAENLPQARNGWPLKEPTISDYFQRKRWYQPKPDEQRRLSMVDRVQIEQVQKALRMLDEKALQAHLSALPLTGMSPGEAEREAYLAEKLLSERSQ